MLTCDSATFMNLYKFQSVSSLPQIQMATSQNLFAAADGNQTSPDKAEGEDEPFAFESAAGVLENGEDDKNN
jgi:hypothetical protein